ncbi:ABC transporter ATP-binding protein [Pseudonocardia sp. MH-G8]|uniref:ABC transporter ATP-binding protein n=1 Tax=Pseudonocardia sp. MH-G8 TaxID=1854588 RepID=UPI000BA09C85|nr:ABC transporter ATP-binding protein [Pseudonocardia sp. MH-G8]OZM78061.1 nitrate ABC transporter ATP-binding protein [Pseudonocardia sp. MH-G8]
MTSHSSSTVDRPAGTDTMIDVRGVTRRFGDVHALDPVDLTVRRGEFVSIVGPSGCGKSTLLELVAGLQIPDSGSIRAAGTPVTGPRDATSIIFQDSALLPWRSVLDNVAFGLESRGVGRGERHARSRELIDLVGLSGFEDARPAQLSGGMRQRVAIARCLSMEPDLILADEPFGALDEQTRLLMATELLAVVERLSCSVLFVTHSLQEAVLLSDRVVVMSARPGRVLEELPVALERPRSTHALTTPAATAVVDRLWSLLRDEADSAMQAHR